MNDPYASKPEFSVASMTEAINMLPNTYGRLGELGLFTPKPIITPTIIIERKLGTLSLLTSTPRGSAGQVNKRSTRDQRALIVPHFRLDDVISAADVAAARAFGTENVPESFLDKVNEIMGELKSKHDITHEWLRWGALKGLILDSDGSTIYDLYDEFGITQKSVDFDLGNANTDVPSKCREVVRHVEDHLLGDVSNGVNAEVSAEFFDALVKHKSVKELYTGWAAAETKLGGDIRKGFNFCGIVFSEFRGQATDFEGNVNRFIAEGEGHAYPSGTTSTFRFAYAPANFISTVNKPGKPYYASIETMEHEMGLKVHTQSNPLPLCMRPAVLVRLFTGS